MEPYQEKKMANFTFLQRDLIENLDELPFPAYDLFPLGSLL